MKDKERKKDKGEVFNSIQKLPTNEFSKKTKNIQRR